MKKYFFIIFLILNQILNFVSCFKYWKNSTDLTFNYRVDLINQGKLIKI